MSEFPLSYPAKLRPISWCMSGICGPMPYWNKHLDFKSKYCGLFVKDVLLDIFYKNGCGREVAEGYCNFFVKAFTVYFDFDESCFKVTVKKRNNKYTGKREPVISAEDFKKAFADIGFTSKEGSQLTRHICQELKNIYNKMVMTQMNENEKRYK